MTTIANVLTEDTDSRGDRVLALEEYKVHYNMTRDTSLRTKSEWVHRFSCKDVFMVPVEVGDHHLAVRREKLPMYQTWIVGQIHASAISRNYCTTGVDLEAPDTFCVLTIKCPETADRPSKQFFQKQIAALETVLEKDVSDGLILTDCSTDWFGPHINGMRTIDVVICGDDLISWTGSTSLPTWVLLPGQLVKVHLSLTRDHAADGTLKAYTAWIGAFMVLEEEYLDT
ncbi:hypothetical protein B0H10DRAFT_2214822 [Mycena sp. CBHHK59/15]|nr:hypothetical protein B0H10DRAFT_2230804 [Mycena sp. CBHHK59/15]KAJ6621750.1 hypothetical protein B0H10DRAFT_2214822 [Mycena sp. CBHHK59/15]